ncbi:MAG TPA: MFS transporter [Burkholderiales bacterium]
MLEFLSAFSAFVGRGWSRPLIVGALLLGLWTGLSRAGLTPRRRWIVMASVGIPLIAWMFAALELAQGGVFRPGASTVPAIPLAVLIPLIIGLPLLLRSQSIAAALDAVPASWLIGLQVYRVLGAVFLARWAAGELPGAFALPAGIGDTLVGALALPVAFYVHSRGRDGIAAAVRWNLLGIADLVTALSMGAMTVPGPLQRFALDFPNTGVGTYPLAMIPAFAVPLSLILHGLSLWQLRRRNSTPHAGSAVPLPRGW